MPSNLCDISLLPDTIQPCAVHCPVDCVVSSWGPWDHCRANECDQLGVKKAKGSFLFSEFLLTLILTEITLNQTLPAIGSN